MAMLLMVGGVVGVASIYGVWWMLTRAYHGLPFPRVVRWNPWVGHERMWMSRPLDFFRESRRRYGAYFYIQQGGHDCLVIQDKQAVAQLMTNGRVYQQSPSLERRFIQTVGVDALHSVASLTHAEWSSGKVDRQLRPAFRYAVPKVINTYFARAGTTGVGWTVHNDMLALCARVFFDCLVSVLFHDGWSNDERYAAFGTLEVALRESMKYEKGGLPITQRIADAQKVMRDACAVRMNDEIDLGGELNKLTTGPDDPKGIGTKTMALLLGVSSPAALVFWTLTHLLADRDLLQQVMLEEYRGDDAPSCPVRSPTPSSTDSGTSTSEAPHRSMLDCIMAECLRIYSFTAAPRELEQDVTIAVEGRTVSVPKNSHVMAVPMPFHHSDEEFRNAESFNPSRWSNASNIMIDMKRGYLPFHAGPHMCPGRFLTVACVPEIIRYLLANLDVELLDTSTGVPPSKPFLGMCRPAKPIAFRYRWKKTPAVGSDSARSSAAH